MTGLLVFLYFAGGLAFALWVRPGWDPPDEWWRLLAIMILAGVPLWIGLIAVRVWQEVTHAIEKARR
ncbi:MAG: hypothetical protein WD492_12695 [Alkalispirochaeta sp.]